MYLIKLYHLTFFQKVRNPHEFHSHRSGASSLCSVRRSGHFSCPGLDGEGGRRILQIPSFSQRLFQQGAGGPAQLFLGRADSLSTLGLSLESESGRAHYSHQNQLGRSAGLRLPKWSSGRGKSRDDRKPGHDTPTGHYTIIRKDIDHKSNLYGVYEDANGNVISGDAKAGDPVPAGSVYDSADMPYYMRLRDDGVGMHGGYIPGTGPASHGCIRLPHAFAELLYSNVSEGTPVDIVQ